jgi:dTDP-glucose pyrophosphorylase
MREQLKKGKESISAAIEGLINNDDMEAVIMKKQEQWIDIDTPEAYQHALSRSY